MADDEDVIARINELAHEEHELFERESRGQAAPRERARLKEIEVQLDQCYDVLHQRRARRAAGLDPNEVSVRDAATVEGYTG
ncbi:MAG TPA: DUF2630 family protein [Actinomycetota bacterium]